MATFATVAPSGHRPDLPEAAAGQLGGVSVPRAFDNSWLIDVTF